MKINGIVISDIHFGAMKASLLYKELEKEFLLRIKAAEDLDVVFIAGDLFDKKLSFNEEHARYAIKFINNLITLSRKKGFKIRLIKGTRNHDLNQLNNFQTLEGKNKTDFRIINTVQEEEMFGEDFKVLYLPEEYMEDVEEYYEDTLYNEETHYDLIVGHGCMEFQSFEAMNHLSERKIANAPTFKNQLMIDKGNLTIFGHIHNRCNYKEKLYYCGSFSRWIFGEEKPKGYIQFSYDTDTKDYTVEYINNRLAREFKTIDINEIINDNTIKVQDKIKLIKEIKENSGSDMTKFKYTVTDNNEENQIIKNYFSETSDIVIASKKETLRQDESEKELLEEYSFIFNKEFSLSETISKYLEKKGQTMSPDRISELLNKEE